ncbi:hypothetical protein OA342_01535 [Pelagibacteraceae bacterium]|nr:hypothetical protein [Pelagibacteraceae bacterium]
MKKIFILLILSLALVKCTNDSGDFSIYNLSGETNQSQYWSYGNCNQSYYPDRFLCGLELRQKSGKTDPDGNALQNYATNLATKVVEGKISNEDAHSDLDSTLNEFHLWSESQRGIDPDLALLIFAGSLAGSYGYSLSDFTDDVKDTAAALNSMPTFAISTNSTSNGLTKVCNYTCLGSPYSITVSSTAICPLNPPCKAPASLNDQNTNIGNTTCFKTGEYAKSMNKVCNYNCLGSPHSITISSVELCPISVMR